MPRAVAAGTSMLSTPTPARPTTRKAVAVSSKSPVTLVSLRTTNPRQPASASRSSARSKPVRFSTTKPASRNGCRPLSLTLSATNIFAGVFDIKIGCFRLSGYRFERGGIVAGLVNLRRGVARTLVCVWVAEHRVKLCQAGLEPGASEKNDGRGVKIKKFRVQALACRRRNPQTKVCTLNFFTSDQHRRFLFSHQTHR